MLNYNLNINSPLQQEKKNEDVRPPIYWSFSSTASASDDNNLAELGFATMSIFAVNSNCIQVSNDADGEFTTDAQFPVTASMTGSNWPITGSTTMSIFTSGITYDPASVNQFYFASVSASALDIYNNPNITGSKLVNNFSASEFFRFYVNGIVNHTKGNVYNPIINWKAINQSPSTDTGNVNGFTASFNIVKNANESLVALPQVTGSTVAAFNNQYALNITSSLSASILNDATGSTTMSIIIPNAGISTSSLILNQTTPGLQTISASFTASNNNDYNITASVIMNKGNIWNATLNVLSTGSNADSYSLYTIPTQFNLLKDVDVDTTVISQNVTLLSYALTASKTDTLQTNYAFNFQNDITESGTYPIYQVHTYPTTSLILTPAGTSSVRYDSGSIISYTELPYTASYNLTASAFINKVPALEASIIVLGAGGGGGGGTTNGGAPGGRAVAGGGGGAGGFMQYDFSLIPNVSYDIISVGAAGTGSSSGTQNGQTGGDTLVKVWLGPIAQNGTGSLVAGGGAGGTTNGTFFNQNGGRSGGANLQFGGTVVIDPTYLAIKAELAGGAGASDDNAGGGGGITGSGQAGNSALPANGGINLGGGGGAWQSSYSGTGSGAPTIYFQSSSFTWTGSAGNGSATGNGNNATALGGGGGGAYASSSLIGGTGGNGAVIIAYSGSQKLTVPNGTITTFSNGVTWHLIKTTGSFSYDYTPIPNPEEQNYIWRADTLVVAGGGAGSNDIGAGGGAGGYILNPYEWYQIGKPYTINVGLGMPGFTSPAPTIRSGSDSYIVDSTNGQTLLFAKGGGAGASNDGGSGGGGNAFGNPGGQAIPGYQLINYYITSSITEGFAGGAADPSFGASGGGGGASTTGSNGNTAGGQGAQFKSGMGGLGKYDLSFTPIPICGGGLGYNYGELPTGSGNSVFWGGGVSGNTGSNATSFGGGGGAGYATGLTGAGGNGLIQIKYDGTARATGGQIETALVSGSYYTLHTFTASGTFTPIR
jgi:hypothetical protein